MARSNLTITNSRIRSTAVLLALIAACAAPAEVTVLDPLVPVRAPADLSAATPLKSIRIVVPRNGFGSAVVYVEGTNSTPPKVSNPVLDGGSAELVAVLRYADKPADETLAFEKIGAGGDATVLRAYHDALLPEPPAGGDLLAVWITVNPSREARPGTYRGQVSIAKKSLPLAVEVSPWICPDPGDWATHVGLLTSPETLSLHYGKPLWSPEHLELVSRELELAAGLGNKDLWLSVFPSNHLGQASPWITFTRKGDRLEPDLGVLEKYLDVYNKAAGEPEHLLLDLWNSNHAPLRRSEENAKVPVVVDGAVTMVPHPGHTDSEKVWPTLIRELNKRFGKLGWKEDSFSIGCADDRRPARKVVAFFKAHAPKADWAIWTHGRGDPPPWKGVLKIAGMDVSHYEHLFCPHTGGTREDGVVGGWDLSVPEYGSARNLLPKLAPPVQYRSLADGMTVNINKSSRMMNRNSAGFTRICLDFWPVAIPGRSGPKRPLLLAYEDKPWNIFYRNNTRSIVEPGPKGPVATVRYEMLREGLQECEARIAIEKALASGKLPRKLEQKAREHLGQRLSARESQGRFKGGHAGNAIGAAGFTWAVGNDWQDSTLELFRLAAEIQQR